MRQTASEGKVDDFCDTEKRSKKAENGRNSTPKNIRND